MIIATSLLCSWWKRNKLFQCLYSLHWPSLRSGPIFLGFWRHPLPWWWPISFFFSGLSLICANLLATTVGGDWYPTIRSHYDGKKERS